MRLIDADALVRELISIKATFGSGNGLVEGGIEIAISTTNAQPTVSPDMAQVLSYECGKAERKRGRWIHDGYDIPHGVDWMHCSVCGRREPHVPAAMTNFCPNCGADMRGENNG